MFKEVLYQYYFYGINNLMATGLNIPEKIYAFSTNLNLSL